MGTTADRIRERPREIRGLDGLRALAIVAVLVFHLRPASLTGGFIGVDVFFVVSGFLITTLLLREITSKGRLDLVRFWARRARRLLPALVLVVVVAVSAGLLIGEDLLVGIGRQTFGALTFSSNWVEVVAGSSYFAGTSPQLFANFWSLAVEEQFYLFWPLLFALVMALVPTWSRRAGLALAAAGASGLLMAVLVRAGEDATRVYYGTDTHAFGLLLGVGLAFAWATTSFLDTPAWRRLSPGVGALSLAGLLALMVVLDEGNVLTFRGGLLLASLLTATLIAALLPAPAPLLAAFELRPVRWLGERSYGIYLWHWPAILVAAALFPGVAPDSPAHWAMRAGALATTLAAAAVSFELLETPIRQRGFRAVGRDVLDAVRGPVLIPKLATCAVAVLAVMTVAGIITAPEKSEAQVAIEAGERAIAARSAGERPAAGGELTRGVAPVCRQADTAVPAGEEITVFGDSIVVTSADGLEWHFPGIAIDARSNDQWDDGEGVITAALAAGTVRRAVVIDYGTNGGISDEARLRRILDALGPKRAVVLVNLHSASTFIASSNALLEKVAAGRPNVVVADWAGAISQQPELLQPDRVHPGIEGAHLYARTIAAAFEELAAR